MPRLLRVVILCLVLSSCNQEQVSINLAALPSPQVRTYYMQQLELVNGPESATFSVSAGRLPFGLVLEPDGRLLGMPTAVQRVFFEVTATSGEHSWMAEADWTVSDGGAFRLLVEDLPVAEPGTTFEHHLSAIDGQPVDWRLVRSRTILASAGDPETELPILEQVPSWLQFDSTSGVLSGMPEGESVVLLLVEASDGSVAAREVYALRVGNPADDGWLKTKSEAYVDRFFEAHIPSGLHLSILDGICHGHYGDSCCWTSTILGGLAFRAAVLDHQEAYEKVERVLEGLYHLRLITGVPGLPGRGYERDENIGGACGRWYMDLDHPDMYAGTGEYQNWRFWTETSRDQFTGNMWGHGIVWEILVAREDLRARAGENINALASHIWDNEMKIVDLDGLVTNYGVMSGYGFDGFDPYFTGVTSMPNGMNALMLLNWFQMASLAAPDRSDRTAFRARLADLISNHDNPEPGREFEHSYLDILHQNYCYNAYNPAGLDYFEAMSWYNVHMAFSNYFHLVRLAGDSDLRSQYMESYRSVLWEDTEPMESGCERPEARRARREFNPHFTFEYLAALGDRDPEALFECLTHLFYFAAPPRRDYQVDNPLGVETIPGHDDWACEPVPIHLQPQSSNYLWHRSPYRHTGGGDDPEGHEDGGGDGFVPYWMGRYFGFVPASI